MPDIRSGHVTVFYLFDVAEAIDLRALHGLTPQAVRARPAPKPPSPSYFQFQQPPLVVDGEVVGTASIEGLDARVKFYDYGVVSLALSRPFSGTWPELIAIGQGLMDHEPLDHAAERAVRDAVMRLLPAFVAPHTQYLAEDYLVFAVTAFQEPVTADRLLEQHGRDIAQLLRGEQAALSAQETEEVLRHRLSYLADDLAIPAWNTAFVYDTEPGTQGALEIFEYANSQLLEFRHYDDLLETKLARIYGVLKEPRRFDLLAGRRFTLAARELHSVFVDVNELTDRTENALKMVGDIYAARLFGLVTARLGLDRWKANVRDKLETLDDIYRFAVDQTGMSHGNFLELIIVLILVLELILFFVGVMR
jgi:hypothetical protein